MTRSNQRTQTTLRERAKQEKLRRIRTAAAELLADRSFSELTMREVAERAEVGEATLFRYVASKEDLLLLVSEQRLESLIHSVEAAERYQPGQGRTGKEILARIFELYEMRAADYVENPQNVTDYARVGLTANTPIAASSMDHGDRFILIVEGLLAHGQTAGLLRSEWSARVIARNCHSTFVHEVVRSPGRGFTTDTFSARLRERLEAQLEPLIVE